MKKCSKVDRALYQSTALMHYFRKWKTNMLQSHKMEVMALTSHGGRLVDRKVTVPHNGEIHRQVTHLIPLVPVL